MRKQEIRLTPEQALEQVEQANQEWTEAINKLENLKSTDSMHAFRKAKREEGKAMNRFDNLVMSFVTEPNAEAIYSLLVEKMGDYSYEDQLVEAFGKEPYAGKLFMKMMEHPSFHKFDEDIQVLMFSMPLRHKLLEKYFSLRYDFCDEGEVLIFDLKNSAKIVERYMNLGFGLCFGAQKKMLELPEYKIDKLLSIFVNTIDEKNYHGRLMCTKM